MDLKSLFIDCNDQLAPVWQRVARAEDPPIDVNRATFAPAELSRLLNGYDIRIDDHVLADGDGRAMRTAQAHRLSRHRRRGVT
jgi:hypothetical protein